jgi:ketosteroid isomerase-like protein
MNRLIAALLFALITTGCGGGGGSKSSLSPTAAVVERTTSWRSAQVAENVAAVMALYSDSFAGEDGGTKADVQANFQTMIDGFDIQRIDVINQSYTAAPSGELVMADVDLQYSMNSRATGEQVLVHLVGSLEWAREAGQWRILHANLVESTPIP